MPCKVKVDTQLKKDILGFDKRTKGEIYQFLLALQNKPFPEFRELLDPEVPNAFSSQLDCGCFLSWEVSGELLDLLKTRDCLIRILGAAFTKP
ncbi:MAG: hypothetical protein ABI197_07065 [Granulicella sp.]